MWVECMQSQSQGTIDSRVLSPSLEMSPLFHSDPRQIADCKVNLPPKSAEIFLQWALLFILKLFCLFHFGQPTLWSDFQVSWNLTAFTGGTFYLLGNIGGGRNLWYLWWTEQRKLANPESWSGGPGNRERAQKRDRKEIAPSMIFSFPFFTWSTFYTWSNNFT